MTYLAFVDHHSQHASALGYRNVLDMYFSALPAANCCIKTVVELWKGEVALVVTERVYVGVHIRIKMPTLVDKSQVVALGLSPDGP